MEDKSIWGLLGYLEHPPHICFWDKVHKTRNADIYNINFAMQDKS